MSSKPRFVGEWVQLGELGKTQSGGTPSSKHPEFFSGSIPWIGTTALNGKLLDESNAVKMITAEAVEKSATKIVPAGSIMVGIRVGVGKVAINSVPMCTSQDIVSIIGIDEGQWNKEYISLALQYKAPILASQAQGATITGITSKTLKSITIPVLSLVSQNAIVSQLRSIEQQIAYTKVMLEQLDSLAKSRFVEMFEESDRYNGSVYRLADIGEIASGITKGRKARDKELFETPYLSTANVQAGRLDLSAIKTIDATMPEIEKFRLAEGDVLMTEGGDPDKVGRGAVAHNLPKNCIHQNHVFRVRLNRVILYPEYFEMFLQSPGCREYFFRASKQTTGIATINKTQLRNMQVLVPPIKAQEEFLAFASQVDKSRFLAQQQIEKLQMLYDSLAQDYFGD